RGSACALAFLAVIPAADLPLPLLFVIPEGDLRLRLLLPFPTLYPLPATPYSLPNGHTFLPFGVLIIGRSGTGGISSRISLLPVFLTATPCRFSSSTASS